MPAAGLAGRGLGKPAGCGGGCGCSGGCSGGGCEYGGNCGARRPSRFLGSTGLKKAPSSVGGRDRDSLPEPIYGPGDGGRGPAASLCGSMRQSISWLRGEIDRLMELLGPRANEIATAWRQAREICASPDAPSLCWSLELARVAAGSRLPPPGVDDQDAVDAYNAAWGAALHCSNSASGMDFAAQRFWGCMAAISGAQYLERRAAGEMKMSPPVSYLEDIEPLEQELRATLVDLAECERSVPDPGFDEAARWSCSASCNVEGREAQCTGRVTGSATGPSEGAACREAKREATQRAPRGCYARHCQCSCSRR